MKKVILVFLILITILYFCGDLERDNPLDPKNKSSFTEQKILVELFVNDSTGFDYSKYALEKIEEIEQRASYQDKLLVLEYHIKTNQWNDPLSSNANYERYRSYVPNSSERGVPDAFFNGIDNRVQGASEQNIESRYLAVIDELLGKKSYFRIEADKIVDGNSVEITVQLARLGSTAKDNIHLNAVVYEDLNRSGHRFVVRKIFQNHSINNIKPGQVETFSFSGNVSNVSDPDALYALVFVQDQSQSNLHVYQVARF